MRGERLYHGKEEDRVGISAGFTDVFDLMLRVMKYVLGLRSSNDPYCITAPLLVTI